MRPNILIVDDEENVRFFLQEVMNREGYDVTLAENGTIAIEKAKKGEFDIILLDLRMPDINGIEVLEEIKKINPALIVIIITAYGTKQIAYDAIKKGAYDYFSKPVDIDELRIVVKRAVDKLNLEKEIGKLRTQITKSYDFDNIIGKSNEIQEVFEIASKIINNDVTVLIFGESGTGKELLARAIHFNSLRKNKPFVRLNCAAIPESLLESEMFGHEKGSFTGAYERRIGKFEQADGGTLFFDEIGDMSLMTQAKLLRVLQEKDFERVGGTKTIKVDIRIIAATNKDLLKAVNEKNFREDLYFRLNVISIYLPTLRERKSDIPILLEHFIGKYNTKFNMNVLGISDEVMEMLRDYNWPGNIREMENVIQRAMVLQKEGYINKEFLLFTVDRSEAVGESKQNMSFPISLSDEVYHLSSQLEKKLVEEALKITGGKRQETADLLGISRKSLHNKMKKYGIDV